MDGGRAGFDRPGTSIFLLPRPDTFDAPRTKVKRPVEVAYFSFDREHNLLPFSEASLRYYYPPTFGSVDPDHPIDLCKGYDTFRQRSDTGPDEHLDALLDTIIEAEKRKGAKFDVDLITWRGMMTRILTAPYESDDGFEMNATSFQGTIYIEENHDFKLRSKADQDKSYRPGHLPKGMPPFWGYKFETLATLSKPWTEATRDEIEGREAEIVDNGPQFCSFVTTGIGDTTMLLAGEVDCVLDYRRTNLEEPSRYVELKTSRMPDNRRAAEIYDKKLLKFWAQSFLLGVSKIFIGCRDGQGKLLSVQELDTMAIPNTVKQVGVFKWDGNACVSIAGKFLDFLKSTVVSEGVWRIRRTGAGQAARIEVFKIKDTGTGQVLSRRFIEWREELAAK